MEWSNNDLQDSYGWEMQNGGETFVNFNNPFPSWKKMLIRNEKKKHPYRVFYVPPNSSTYLSSLIKVQKFFDELHNEFPTKISFKVDDWFDFRILFCVCHKKESGMYVQCIFGKGGCNGWMHPECIADMPIDKKSLEFICPLCVAFLEKRRILQHFCTEKTVCLRKISDVNSNKVETVVPNESTEIIDSAQNFILFEEYSNPHSVWGLESFPYVYPPRINEYLSSSDEETLTPQMDVDSTPSSLSHTQSHHSTNSSINHQQQLQFSPDSTSLNMSLPGIHSIRTQSSGQPFQRTTSSTLKNHHSRFSSLPLFNPLAMQSPPVPFLNENIISSSLTPYQQHLNVTFHALQRFKQRQKTHKQRKNRAPKPPDPFRSSPKEPNPPVHHHPPPRLHDVQLGVPSSDMEVVRGLVAQPAAQPEHMRPPLGINADRSSVNIAVSPVADKIVNNNNQQTETPPLPSEFQNSHTASTPTTTVNQTSTQQLVGGALLSSEAKPTSSDARIADLPSVLPGLCRIYDSAHYLFHTDIPSKIGQDLLGEVMRGELEGIVTDAVTELILVTTADVADSIVFETVASWTVEIMQTCAEEFIGELDIISSISSVLLDEATGSFVNEIVDEEVTRNLQERCVAILTLLVEEDLRSSLPEIIMDEIEQESRAVVGYLDISEVLLEEVNLECCFELVSEERDLFFLELSSSPLALLVQDVLSELISECMVEEESRINAEKHHRLALAVQAAISGDLDGLRMVEKRTSTGRLTSYKFIGVTGGWKNAVTGRHKDLSSWESRRAQVRSVMRRGESNSFCAQYAKTMIRNVNQDMNRKNEKRSKGRSLKSCDNTDDIHPHKNDREEEEEELRTYLLPLRDGGIRAIGINARDLRRRTDHSSLENLLMTTRKDTVDHEELVGDQLLCAYCFSPLKTQLSSQHSVSKLNTIGDGVDESLSNQKIINGSKVKKQTLSTFCLNDSLDKPLVKPKSVSSLLKYVVHRKCAKQLKKIESGNHVDSLEQVCSGEGTIFPGKLMDSLNGTDDLMGSDEDYDDACELCRRPGGILRYFSISRNDDPYVGHPICITWLCQSGLLRINHNFCNEEINDDINKVVNVEVTSKTEEHSPVMMTTTSESDNINKNIKEASIDSHEMTCEGLQNFLTNTILPVLNSENITTASPPSSSSSSRRNHTSQPNNKDFSLTTACEAPDDSDIRRASVPGCEPLSGLESLVSGRRCVICGQDGVTIRCAHPICRIWCHPLCAFISKKWKLLHVSLCDAEAADTNTRKEVTIVLCPTHC